MISSNFSMICCVNNLRHIRATIKTEAPAASNRRDMVHQNGQALVDSFHPIIFSDKYPSSSARSLQQLSSVVVNVDFSTSYFLAEVFIGSQETKLYLSVDTGSDLSWTQCQNCKCYQQHDPLFDPSKSTTYKSVPCSSDRCSELASAKASTCTKQGHCMYNVIYGDGTSSTGVFSNDTLTLKGSVEGEVKVPAFHFGCGYSNKRFTTDIYVDGVLGLGRGFPSLINQTQNILSRVFSYCIAPFSSANRGYLMLGGGPNTNWSFTKLTNVPDAQSFYTVDLVGMDVAGVKVNVSSSVFQKSGAMIDSGTHVTWFPRPAYEGLRDSFRNKMKSKYGSFQQFDTCYDLTESQQIPTIDLKFGGGAVLSLVDPDAIFIGLDPKNPNNKCLAFLANKNENDIAILGNRQQQGIPLLYDIPNSRIGIGPNSPHC